MLAFAGCNRICPSGFSVVSLESCFRSVHQCDNDLAIARLAGFLDQDEIAVADVIFDHRFAADLQGEGVFLANEIREVERLLICDCLNRHTSRNAAKQRDIGTRLPGDVALALQLKNRSPISSERLWL